MINIFEDENLFADSVEEVLSEKVFPMEEIEKEEEENEELDKYVNNEEIWYLHYRIISQWNKIDYLGNKMSLTLIATDKISSLTGEARRWFQIVSPKNPLPVKGEFMSSYLILKEWLEKDGWVKSLIVPERRIVYAPNK